MYAGADALVLPSRGEGWGRPHVEAMAMGLALVATNWSGPTEFMTEENSTPSPSSPISAAASDSHFATHMWSQPSVGHLRARMREWRGPGRPAKGARARRELAKRFSPAAVARVVVGELGRIGGGGDGVTMRREREMSCEVRAWDGFTESSRATGAEAGGPRFLSSSLREQIRTDAHSCENSTSPTWDEGRLA